MTGDVPQPPVDLSKGRAAPRLADLFVMRALGVRIETLARRFGLTETQVRAIFAAWGEPARLQPSRWVLDAHRRGERPAPATFAARTAGRDE